MARKSRSRLNKARQRVRKLARREGMSPAKRDAARELAASLQVSRVEHRIVGVEPPTVTFVEYADVVFMFTNGGQKFSMETGSYASIAKAVEQIEATGAIRIATQNLRHLNARSSAH